MITVKLKGGLGNQLFQYAAAYALAKRLNQQLCIDYAFFPKQTLRGYKLPFLKIDNSIIGSPKRKPLFLKIVCSKYINYLIRKKRISRVRVSKNSYYRLEVNSCYNEWFQNINDKNIYLEGYFQSDLYFKEFRADLIKQFEQNYELENEYKMQVNEIINTNSVAIHVRRGDFLKVQYNSNPHHYLLGESYYRKAIEYMESKVDKPLFFWFSDDIEWVKENFGEQENFRYVSLNTKHADIDELLLMKHCKNIIAANSTFSWWSSWLNENEDAIHICPEKSYGNKNMIPDNWVKIEVE